MAGAFAKGSLAAGVAVTTVACVIAMSGPSFALSLDMCERTTHISHAGEDMHRDLGEGRVLWRNWWSQEGTSTDIMLADCGPGEALRLRTAEDNISDRLPFDRTAKTLQRIETMAQGARIFASLDRIADETRDLAEDVTRFSLAQEPCACASLYPDLKGEKAAFAFEELPEGFGVARTYPKTSQEAAE